MKAYAGILPRLFCQPAARRGNGWVRTHHQPNADVLGTQPSSWEDRVDEVQLQQRFFEVLLDKTVQDDYPSTLMLDIIEERMSPQMRAAYISSLLDRIEKDEFPSPSMIKRVSLLLGRSR
jgi:hypothetical protein